MFLKECSAISLVKGTDKYSCQTDRQELKILSDSTVWTLKILPLFGYCRNSCSTRGRSFRNDTALRIQSSKLYPRTITVLCKETGITSYTCYVLPKILSVNKDINCQRRFWQEQWFLPALLQSTYLPERDSSVQFGSPGDPFDVTFLKFLHCTCVPTEGVYLPAVEKWCLRAHGNCPQLLFIWSFSNLGWTVLPG